VTALFGTTCSAAAGSGLCSSSAWAPLVCQQSCGRCPGRCGNDDSKLAALRLWGLLNPTCSDANINRCADPFVGYLYQNACCNLCRGVKMPSVFASVTTCADNVTAVRQTIPAATVCADVQALCLNTSVVALNCPVTCRRCGLTRAPSSGTPPGSSSSSSSSLSTGAKIGLGVGIPLGLLLVVAAVVLLSAEARKKTHQHSLQQPTNAVVANPTYSTAGYASPPPIYETPGPGKRF